MSNIKDVSIYILTLFILVLTACIVIFVCACIVYIIITILEIALASIGLIPTFLISLVSLIILLGVLTND